MAYVTPTRSRSATPTSAAPQPRDRTRSPAAASVPARSQPAHPTGRPGECPDMPERAHVSRGGQARLGSRCLALQPGPSARPADQTAAPTPPPNDASPPAPHRDSSSLRRGRRGGPAQTRPRPQYGVPPRAPQRAPGGVRGALRVARCAARARSCRLLRVFVAGQGGTGEPASNRGWMHTEVAGDLLVRPALLLP